MAPWCWSRISPPSCWAAACCAARRPPSLQAELLPQIASGDLLLAFAHVERQSRYELHNVATIAREEGGRWRLEGEKGVVLHGDCANKLLVTARTSRWHAGPRLGIGLFLVDVPGEGVSARGYPTQDGLRAAESRWRAPPACCWANPAAPCRWSSGWPTRRWPSSRRKPWA